MSTAFTERAEFRLRTCLRFTETRTWKYASNVVVSTCVTSVSELPNTSKCTRPVVRATQSDVEVISKTRSSTLVSYITRLSTILPFTTVRSPTFASLWVRVFEFHRSAKRQQPMEATWSSAIYRRRHLTNMPHSASTRSVMTSWNS